MTHNPVSDVIDFPLQPAWTTVAFWLLMLASVAIACYAFVKIPGRRRFVYLRDWIFRFAMAACGGSRHCGNCRAIIPITRTGRLARAVLPIGWG